MTTKVISQLISLLQQYGVYRFVMSPGSRNAAIIQEIADRKDIQTEVIVDERSAAFLALGMSLVSQTPTALVCTSGSALLNYAPAVAEAYYQGVPLIIISADRPLEWIDQDDSQTIRQPGSLATIVKCTIDLNGELEDPDYLWFANRKINEALLIALSRKEGPVHINIRLSGTFSHKVNIEDVKKIDIVKPIQRLSNSVIKKFSEYALNKKIMFIAGFMPPNNKLQKAVLNLSSLPNVCIMAETLSNLHLPEEDYLIDTALFPIEKEIEEKLRPDIVISIGGALISRKLKEYLRSNPPKAHWSLSYSDNLIDCFKSLTIKIECSEDTFVSGLSKILKRELKERKDLINNYKLDWSRQRKKEIKNINTVPWSDLKAMALVLQNLPEDVNLFLSNGTSVRYGQILPYHKTHATYSNRGVSGIEGCTSTAIGGSRVYNKLTVLITGDMSFSHDLGGFACGEADNRMRIIVLDNNGGDIFRFIGATKDLKIREDFLSLPKENPIEMLAAAYQWEYYYANDEDSLLKEFNEFFQESPCPGILHIDTRKCDNASILTNYLKGIKGNEC